MRASVEETHNNLQEAEADQLCNSREAFTNELRTVSIPVPAAMNASSTTGGEVTLKVPRLRTLPLRRRSSTVSASREQRGRGPGGDCTWRA